MESVIDECTQLKTDYRVDAISFMDDVFTLDVNWLENFTAKYKEKNEYKAIESAYSTKKAKVNFDNKITELETKILKIKDG